MFTTRPAKCWSRLPRALVLLHPWGLPKPNWVKPSTPPLSEMEINFMEMRWFQPERETVSAQVKC